MRIIVCGPRETKFTDSFVFNKLDYITKHYPISILICGMARGVDTIAYKWAMLHSISIMKFPITKNMWNIYGNSAGPIRNLQMIKDGCAEMTIAFKTNAGSGTKNMISQSKTHGIKLIIAEEFEPELML